MATSSNDLTTLDFESVKENLKTYLKAQPIFNDYDFEASNINVLLDILAYNTNLNGFYLNMIANEMFMDSSLLKDSIISHAKELNYLPRSFRSAIATVDIELSDSSPDATITIPRGTSFTGSLGNKSFTFTTDENIQAIATTSGKFEAKNVFLYEGDYVQDSYVTSADNPQYIISNKTVDTNSIRVTVIEDNGAEVLAYTVRDSLFDIGSTDQVFFIQPAVNDTYEIIFGDGVIGREPKLNSIVVIEYRAGNGELPNGISKFAADDDIGSATVEKITTTSAATGGSIPESLESIKFNAPRAFTTQERVVTAQDYATLLRANFSEINDVAAYGGEEFDPPMFGRVVVAVDLKNTDDLPQSYMNKYRQFLKPRSPLSINPMFMKPEYMYLSINTNVKYDISQTSLGVDDIKTLVTSSIQNFNQENLDGFNKTLFYSKLVAAIDDTQTAIISNDTTVNVSRYIQLSRVERMNYRLDFAMPLVNDIGSKQGTHSSGQRSVVTSSAFVFDGTTCFIEDNGLGILNIVRDDGETHTVLAEVGRVAYNTGVVELDNFYVNQDYNQLKITVTPREKDIVAAKRSILRVLEDDINVAITQVRN